ncbi:MAG: hypothetical protein AAGA96_01810 [Verrucomicrobiota bacterium]
MIKVLCQDVLHYVARHIGESESSALESIGESLVIGVAALNRELGCEVLMLVSTGMHELDELRTASISDS